LSSLRWPKLICFGDKTNPFSPITLVQLGNNP